MSDVQAEKQTRIQSPSYPVWSLKEAIVAVSKIEGRYRSSIIDRVDAAKLLGYSGATGPSAMALAALSAYGLIERAGKGEVRVTERAKSILHPANEAERKSAIWESAVAPNLYRELRERFPDMHAPPEEGVITFLNRQGFNPAAVKPAAKAFLQTMAYLREVGEPESNGVSAVAVQESAPDAQYEEPSIMLPQQPLPPTPTQVLVPPVQLAQISASHGLALNEPALSIRANTVLVEALLDYDGLTELEEQIKALKMILKQKRRQEEH